MKIAELNIKRTPFISEFRKDVSDIKFYAGIGSRGTPLKIGEVMIELAYFYGLKGFGLRSGGAEGADTFFEIGADLARLVDPTKGYKQIFLPEKNFFFNPSEFYSDNDKIWENKEQKETIIKEMGLLAGQFHKGLASMDIKSKNLMLRNGQQVMGQFLNDPSLAVICWTPDRAICHEDRNLTTGGTGQAISIASSEYIVTGMGETRYVKGESQQVINLSREDHLNRVLEVISELRKEFGPMPDWKKALKWKPIKDYKYKNPSI